MKIVKGSPFFNFYFIFILLVNILVLFIVYNGMNLKKVILVLLIVDFIAYLRAIHGLHYFIYDENKLIIKNLWNFLLRREIEISRIEEIYKSGAKGGMFIIIKFNGKKKSYGINNLSNDVIDEMITEIHKLIEKKKIEYSL